MNSFRSSELMSVKDLAAQAQKSPDVIHSYLEAIFDRINTRTNNNEYFTAVLMDSAFQRATELQGIPPQIRKEMPLFGVPFALKDNIDFKTSVTTCGSASMPGTPAGSSAAVVCILEAAGAVCVGKTIMSEFSLGEIPPHVPWSELVNPIMPTHSPGSSSQGSTAVVASGLVPFSIGTDTGGSIRHPSAAMGVYGLKPTNGSLNLDGVFPLSHSLDTVGPIARSLEDLESVCEPLFQIEAAGLSHCKTLKIGFPETLWASASTADSQVLDEMAKLRNRLSSNGIQVVDLKLPPLQDYQLTGWDILNYEAYHTHASIFEVKSAQCGDMFLQHMEAGRATSDEKYLNAKARARELASAVDDALQDVDFLVSPIAYRLLPRLGSMDDIEQYNASAIRILFNLSGHPSLVTPLPLAQVGVPFAVQWVTKRFAEAMYFSPAFKSIDELMRTGRLNRPGFTGDC